MSPITKVIEPVKVTFIASLLLSLIAYWNNPVLNRDGMYYVEWAQVILETGTQGFDYAGGGVFLALLPHSIAGFSFLTGVTAESAGYLINAFFLATTCSLIVAITRARQADAAWAACMVVLAMPAFNELRNEILREFGFWFFSILAFWLALRWETTARWQLAIACQLSLVLATLFRLEAVVFFFSLLLWQVFTAENGFKLKRAIAIAYFPVGVIIIASLLFASGLIDMPARITYYLDAANPLNKFAAFNEAGKRLSDSGIFKFPYSREEAGYILFFGLMSVIPVKFMSMSGLLLVPLGYQFSLQSVKASLSRWPLLTWSLFLYVLVLMAFIAHQFFLTGRYVSTLNLLAVPLFASGLALLLERYRRWRILILALLLLTMVANVVSLSPRKTHLVEAAHWIAANTNEYKQIYIDNPRVGYYAKLGYIATGRAAMDRRALAVSLSMHQFDILALDTKRDDEETAKFIRENMLHELIRFTDQRGTGVIIVIPRSSNLSE
jgi:4-amino-4-deoxy-L-arabinose transferase-like glycosyltransferase